MTFTDILGNDRAAAELTAVLTGPRAPMSVLLEGPSGTGRRTLANIYAAGLVCKNGPLPCGTCSACKKVQAGIHPDVFSLRCPDDKQQIPIEQVRGLITSCYVAPNEADCRVFIIEDAGKLGPGGQNALLKILEEPPSGVYFVLTADSRTSLLSTVLSRMLVVTVRPLPPAICLSLIKERLSPTLSDQDLYEQCLVFEGCLGQILDALQDERAEENYRAAKALCLAAAAGDEWTGASILAGYEDKAKDYAGFLKLFGRLLQFLFRAKAGAVPPEGALADAAEKLSTASLVRMIEATGKAMLYQKGNISRPLGTSSLSSALFAAGIS